MNASYEKEADAPAGEARESRVGVSRTRLYCGAAVVAAVVFSCPISGQVSSRYVVSIGAVVPLDPHRSEYGVEAKWTPAPWIMARRERAGDRPGGVYLRVAAMAFSQVELDGVGSHRSEGPGFGLGVGGGLRRRLGEAADLYVGVAIEKFHLLQLAAEDVCLVVGPDCYGIGDLAGQASPFGIEVGLSFKIPSSGLSLELWNFGAVGYRGYHPRLSNQLRLQLSGLFGRGPGSDQP